MYLPIESQRTCATAWLEAATAVNAAPGHEAHNVIIDVAEPLVQTPRNVRIMERTDAFLREHGALPLQSVANTIFPEWLYRRHGAPAFYKVYGEVYKRIKREQGDWGRYFERMIRNRTSAGEINALENLVTKLRKNVHGKGRTFRNVYELSVFDPALDVQIYDAARDAGPVMNRQCLSFLSFKLDRENRVMLTAIYRNHYYIKRLLGNLIGLSRLLAFIARESELAVGALTIVSTHAEIDTGPWGRRKVNELLEACAAAYAETTAA